MVTKDFSIRHVTYKVPVSTAAEILSWELDIPV